jgi:hypothetical protein
MHDLLERVPVAILSGSGYCYIYVTHDRNTWNFEHHMRIIRLAALDVEELQRRRIALEEQLKAYALPKGIVVRGYDDNEAFTLG